MQRKVGTKKFGEAFTVYTLPVLKDNFSYIVHDHETDTAAVVDVSEVKPVVEYLTKLKLVSGTEKASSSENLKFSVLTTHKHWDHSGGNKDLASQFGSSLKIYGGAKDNVPHANHPVNDGDEFAVGNLKVKVFFSPCHTSGHVLYFVHSPSNPSAGSALFSGDTLFVGGIGAFFEGTSKDMLAILDRISETLPKETAVFPGHEYTVNFLKFAKSLDPTNDFIGEKLSHFQSLVAEGNPTVPSTLADELKFNVFMRTRDPLIAKAVKKEGAAPVEVMQALYDNCP